MMFVVFAVLALALVVGWFGRRKWALILLFVFFAGIRLQNALDSGE